MEHGKQSLNLQNKPVWSIPASGWGRGGVVVYLFLVNTCMCGWPVLGVHWKEWCWGWNSNTLVTSWEELTHWKRPWCWEGLGQEEKGTAEDEMAGWHHRLDAHKFRWTPGVGVGQGCLSCCDSWGHKEVDTIEWLHWTELKWDCSSFTARGA